MGIFKFYVYLCIFSFKVFAAEDDSDSSKTAPVYEDIYYDQGMTQDETEKQPPISGASDSKSTQDSTAEQNDANSGKQPQMAGDIVNTFKKPFISLNQGRIGWPEEELIEKLMGISHVDMAEESISYKPSVRLFGFTTHFYTGGGETVENFFFHYGCGTTPGVQPRKTS